MTKILATVTLISCALLGSVSASADGTPPRTTHPLMPGVRCADLWNPGWPRVLHDGQLTGFSPLTCGMKSAPKVWATVDVGGEVTWTRAVRLATGEQALLLNDGRIRLVMPDGTVRWTSSEWGTLMYFGDLRGNGTDYLLIEAGPRVSVVNASTGKTEWVRVFEPSHVYARAAVGDVLPEKPGLEAAIFFQYGEEGCLVNFPPEGEPQIIWQRTVVAPGEHPERADHGCSVRLDLSVPEEPLIWNVRHHRCRGFNARSGEMVSSLAYSIGGGHRRNYGPWALAKGKEGQLYACVVGEAIQTHVHAIRLNREGPSTVAWEHYYGEVYVVPGVAVKMITISDVDGDGEDEVIYNVRDPERSFRSFVRVRDVSTGEVEVEVADQWCAGYVAEVGDDRASCLLGLSAPKGATPDVGEVTVYRFAGPGRLERAGSVGEARTWGTVAMPAEDGGQALLLRVNSETGTPRLVHYTMRDGKLAEVARTDAQGLIEAPIRAVIRAPDGQPVFSVAGSEGTLAGFGWEGQRRWAVPLIGGPTPQLSAADINGDGKAELVVAAPGNRVRVFTIDAQGQGRELWSREFIGQRARQGPLLYDLEGNGRPCVIAPGSTQEGTLCVRAYRGDGSLLWETPLDMSTAGGGTAVAWNAGLFLPGPKAAVAVSVGDAQRTKEGTYLLDGATGELRWYKDLYREGSSIRGFVPVGLPGAFDWDGDGVEELCMDLYSYLALIRGTDGSFAYLRHTSNISAENALFAALLYNSFCPVYRTPEATHPHWFSPLGHGIVGLMDPEPTSGPWREELGYDTPERIGMVDVDGDGVMEVGYAVARDSTFKCRNLWTGEVEWELKLPGPVYGPVLAADVDGDGKGEFIGGSYCIGTNAEGEGELRWKSPVGLGWAVIADFDGDGKGEIACAGQGTVRVLKGEGQTP